MPQFSGMLDGFADGSVGYAALLQHIDKILNADPDEQARLLDAVKDAESRGLNGFDATRLQAYIESHKAVRARQEATDEADIPTEFVGAPPASGETESSGDEPTRDDTELTLEPLGDAAQSGKDSGEKDRDPSGRVANTP